MQPRVLPGDGSAGDFKQQFAQFLAALLVGAAGPAQVAGIVAEADEAAQGMLLKAADRVAAAQLERLVAGH